MGRESPIRRGAHRADARSGARSRPPDVERPSSASAACGTTTCALRVRTSRAPPTRLFAGDEAFERAQARASRLVILSAAKDLLFRTPPRRRSAAASGATAPFRPHLVRERLLVQPRLVDDAVARRPQVHLEVQRDDAGIVDRDLGGALQIRLALDVVDGLQRILGQRVDLGVACSGRGSPCRSPCRG